MPGFTELMNMSPRSAKAGQLSVKQTPRVLLVAHDPLALGIALQRENFKGVARGAWLGAANFLLQMGFALSTIDAGRVKN